MVPELIEEDIDASVKFALSFVRAAYKGDDEYESIAVNAVHDAAENWDPLTRTWESHCFRAIVKQCRKYTLREMRRRALERRWRPTRQVEHIDCQAAIDQVKCDRLRGLLRLRIIHQLTIDQLAEYTGLPPSTVRRVLAEVPKIDIEQFVHKSL